MTESQDGVSGAGREAARVARRRAEIEARPSISPSGPARDRLRVATWNLDSLRARLAGVERFIGRTRPGVLCLQETKTARLSDEATAVFDRLGYHVTHVGSGSHSGVAIATIASAGDVVSSGDFGDEALDREPWVASCLIAMPAPVRIVSVARTPRPRPPAQRRPRRCRRRPLGSSGPAVHMVEPRHRLLPQSRHAHRSHRQRHRARRPSRHDVDHHVGRSEERPSDHAALIADFYKH